MDIVNLAAYNNEDFQYSRDLSAILALYPNTNLRMQIRDRLGSPVIEFQWLKDGVNNYAGQIVVVNGTAIFRAVAADMLDLLGDYYYDVQVEHLATKARVNVFGGVISFTQGVTINPDFSASPNRTLPNDTVTEVVADDGTGGGGGGSGGSGGNLPTGRSATQVLIGPADAAKWGSVNLATMVIGNLGVANLGDGLGAAAETVWCGDATWRQVELSTMVIGNLPVDNLNNGFGANSTTVWIGDGSWGPVDLSSMVAGNLPAGNLDSGFNADEFAVWRGNETWGPVDLSSMVTGDLPAGNLNGGLNADEFAVWRGDETWGPVRTPVFPQRDISGDVIVDRNDGVCQRLSLTGDVTSFAVTNFGVAGQFEKLLLEIWNTGYFTVDWGSTLIWSRRAPLPVTTGAGSKDVVILTTLDGGVTIYATIIGRNYGLP